MRVRLRWKVKGNELGRNEWERESGSRKAGPVCSRKGAGPRLRGKVQRCEFEAAVPP